MSTPPFLELPEGARATEVATPRGPLAALRIDPHDASRPPVVLVPGYTGSKEDFIAILAPIAAAGHPVVAIDQRGQFESPGSGDEGAYEIETLGADVLAVLDGLGAPAHLLGHSFGGLVSRAAAIAGSERLLSLTMLCSGPAEIPPPAGPGIRLLVQVLPTMDQAAIWATKRQMERDAGLPDAAPDIEAWLEKRFLASDAAGLLRCGEQLMETPDRTEELAAAGVPVLVIYGDQDDVWPPALQATMAEQLDARNVALPGLAHSPAAEDPEVTAAALLEFWASV